MAQEAEWITLQRKIFSRFVTQRLRDGGIKKEVKDIVNDAKDGVVLKELVEVLTGEKLPVKAGKGGANKFQQQATIKELLELLQKKMAKTKITCSAENVMEGDVKAVLGLTFQIILNFLKIDDPDAQGGDLKESLLLFFKAKTKGYKGVDIKDLKKSFHDGMAFCALLHKFRPRIVGSYDAISAGPAALGKALDDGEKLGIEKYLPAETVVKLDDVSMVIYLTDWYFGAALLMRQDVAARRIAKLVDMTKLHDQMKADYNAGATALTGWCDQKVASLGDRNFPTQPDGEAALAEVEGLLAQLVDYKKTEKPQQIAAQLDLEALFDNLAVRLANAKRPAFAPAAPPDALEKKLADVDAAELERSKALHAEIAKQNQIIDDRLCKALADAIDTFTGWVNSKKAALKALKGQELDAQLQALEASTGDHGDYDGKHKPALDAATAAVKARNITNNKFTALTADDCAAMWAQYLQYVEKKRELLQSQLKEKESGGLSDEQKAEIATAFAHFDKDGSKQLEKRELRACLASLGEPSAPADVDALLAKYDHSGDAKLSLDEFEDFMKQQLGTSEEKPDILNGFKLIALDHETVCSAKQLDSVINEKSFKDSHVDWILNSEGPKDGDGVNYPKFTEQTFAR